MCSLTKDKNESLGGSLFVDYATLFGLDDKSKKYGYEKDYYDSKLVRVSPGFGFSAPSPFGGRFRLDFGFPLVKEPYDITPSSNIKFSIETGEQATDKSRENLKECTIRFSVKNRYELPHSLIIAILKCFVFLNKSDVISDDQWGACFTS
ncbi:Outer membrane protein assembly factor BamA [Dirofilaria immitis]|nr:Outer membrane protein assembly factor BamA [Dirofilaria immitis]